VREVPLNSNRNAMVAAVVVQMQHVLAVAYAEQP
jgi:pyrimidine deaminase RibD-like protein